jgi:hypothetical protein
MKPIKFRDPRNRTMLIIGKHQMDIDFEKLNGEDVVLL